VQRFRRCGLAALKLRALAKQDPIRAGQSHVKTSPHQQPESERVVDPASRTAANVLLYADPAGPKMVCAAASTAVRSMSGRTCVQVFMVSPI
jgi:hypothetical protein